MSRMVGKGLSCPDCKQRVTLETFGEFVGDPDDFAHRSEACRPRLLAIIAEMAKAWHKLDLERKMLLGLEQVARQHVYEMRDRQPFETAACVRTLHMLQGVFRGLDEFRKEQAERE